MITIFDHLGNEIEQKWNNLDYDEDEFISVVESALLQIRLDELDEQKLLNLCLSSISSTHQVGGVNFGEPPVTVFDGKRFYIEVLFWLSSTTAVHEHSFRGVFKVLFGSSLHSVWKFNEEDRINENMKFGEVRHISSEVLNQYDQRHILIGDEFIHSLFHLDYPSVSLVIRTKSEVSSLPQYSYHQPSIAFNFSDNDIKMVRKAMLLKSMQMTGVNIINYIVNLANELSIDELFLLLNKLADGKLENEVLAELMKKESNPIILKRLHLINLVLKHSNFVRVISDARSNILDKDHRFFLALLMNIPDRTKIYHLIESIYSVDPIDKIHHWIIELNDKNKFNKKLTEFQIDILKILLKNGNIENDEVIVELKKEYESEEIEGNQTQIFESIDVIKRTTLFRAIL